ncbi:unnamed protein product [Paramecium primaurelia]|uniref:Uncharacterized protein n=1 Tax=Paramecium primaurelia TaxID=5886 RepID=A0A8S1JND9_PARPR|nr:unnamed protein product [Paramecium primaurelia]
MGAVCRYQQQSSETYQNQEIQGYLPISKELKPKSINNSIKHDLKAKYQEIDCHICNRPQMIENASQTQVSFYNITQFATLQKYRSKPQKNKKKQKSKDKLIFDNFKTNKQRSVSQSSQTQNKLQKYQSCKNQVKEKLQDSQQYVVMINSQIQSISNNVCQKQIKN